MTNSESQKKGGTYSNDASTPILVNAKSSDEYLLKRTEKILSAIYLLSEHFGVEEPLKWTIRDKGLDLLNAISQFGGKSPRKEPLERAISLLKELDALCAVGGVIRLISDQNKAIIQREFQTLMTLVKEADFQFLSIDFFKFEDESGGIKNLLKNGAEQAEKSLYKGQIYKGRTDSSNVLNDHENVFKRTNLTPKKVEKSQRREEILALIRRIGSVTIKDISKAMKGYGQKTLQRELLLLVSTGILKKEGEKITGSVPGRAPTGNIGIPRPLSDLRKQISILGI